MRDFIPYMVHALPLAIHRALENNDQELLRGLQAFEVTIWTRVRACESFLATLIGKVFEQLDLQNPKLDAASKIGIRMNILVKACGDLGLFQAFTEHLLDHDFIAITKDENTRNDYVVLTPIWNPILVDMKRTGREVYTFSSSIGKLLGLGFLKQGLASFRPLLLMAKKAIDAGGELTMTEARHAWLDAGGQERKFYEFLRRDNRKAEEIRMVALNDGKRIIISRHVLRAYPLLNRLAQQLYRRVGP